MKSIFIVFGLSALAIVSFNTASCAFQVSDFSEEVERSIHDRLEYGKYVSIMIGIVDTEGSRYYSYGTVSPTSDKAADEKSVYEIGSITKVFTTILLADMAQKGELRLDDPIERYLPDHVEAPTRNGHSITLAHLATHTSGLTRMPDNFAPTNVSNPWSDYSISQLYKALSNYTLQRDIGEDSEYSNYGFALLGTILTLRSGMTYGELIKLHIADEIGLKDTGTLLTPNMQERLVKGHRGGVEVPNWSRQVYGHGGLISTAKDLLRFVAANAGLIDTPLYSAMQLTHQPVALFGAKKMAPSLGWEVRTKDKITVIYHDGSTGGYKSFAGFLKGGKKGVIVLTNSKGSVVDLGRHLIHPSFALKDIDYLIKKSGNL